MDAKSDPKIKVWAIRDPTFEVLGRFSRGLILDEFSIGKKSVKNPTFGVRRSAKGGQRGILREGRRVGRGPSEALESAEIGRSIRHASGTPLCETGAADLKGLRPARRPSCVHWTVSKNDTNRRQKSENGAPR